MPTKLLEPISPNNILSSCVFIKPKNTLGVSGREISSTPFNIFLSKLKVEISSLILADNTPSDLLLIVFVGASASSLSQYYLTFLKNSGTPFNIFLSKLKGSFFLSVKNNKNSNIKLEIIHA
jgi:hypothetical protein